jgi:hypothetical protein
VIAEWRARARCVRSSQFVYVSGEADGKPGDFASVLGVAGVAGAAGNTRSRLDELI